MLLVGSPMYKILVEKFDGQEYEGVHFEVGKTQGLAFVLKHDAADDASAKKIVKQVVSEIPECRNLYLNIQYVDENGRIL